MPAGKCKQFGVGAESYNKIQHLWIHLFAEDFHSVDRKYLKKTKKAARQAETPGPNVTEPATGWTFQSSQIRTAMDFPSFTLKWQIQRP